MQGKSYGPNHTTWKVGAGTEASKTSNDWSASSSEAATPGNGQGQVLQGEASINET